MSVSRFACPSCQVVIRSSQPLPVGKKIKCPKCGQVIEVPVLSETSPPPEEEKKAAAAAATANEGLPADIGLAPLEGAEVVDEHTPETKGDVLEVIDDAAIYVEAACTACGYRGN